MGARRPDHDRERRQADRSIVTLELIDRPEREALDLVLRSASGYIAAQRQVGLAGPASHVRSHHDPAGQRGPVARLSVHRRRSPAAAPTRSRCRCRCRSGADSDAAGRSRRTVACPEWAPQSVIPDRHRSWAARRPTAADTAPRPGMLPAAPDGQPNPISPRPERPVNRAAAVVRPADPVGQAMIRTERPVTTPTAHPVANATTTRGTSARAIPAAPNANLVASQPGAR